MGRDSGDLWGFRSPTPRGRIESCTLRILTDALTGAHEKHCMWEGVGNGGAEERWRGTGAPLPTNGDAALPAPLTAQ